MNPVASRDAACVVVSDVNVPRREEHVPHGGAARRVLRAGVKGKHDVAREVGEVVLHDDVVAPRRLVDADDERRVSDAVLRAVRLVRVRLPKLVRRGASRDERAYLHVVSVDGHGRRGRARRHGGEENDDGNVPHENVLLECVEGKRRIGGRGSVLHGNRGTVHGKGRHVIHKRDVRAQWGAGVEFHGAPSCAVGERSHRAVHARKI